MEDLSVNHTKASILSRTHRWAFDLQACQTAGSAHRGVGRYSNALFHSIRARNPAIDCRAVVCDALPYSPEMAKLSSDRICHVPALPPGLGRRKASGGPQDDLDGILLSHRLAPLKADLIHVSHVFEGFGDRVALPSHSFKPPGQVLSATLYDLIPLLFQESYFHSVEFKQWYHARLDWLRKADLLLAISESSRQDAIGLLGIDPARITTVHGGIGEHFLPAPDRDRLRDDLRRRYRLRNRYVLYTGGDDHRKNIAGGIRGYAEVPEAIRIGCQLVIVCAMEPHRKIMYAEIGKQAGLANDELVVTGFLPEADLVAFYQCCDAFVFPSLYEGLGLPVLEAMACGAPTIGGNNSSIAELIGRPDALFDSSSVAATAKALTQVLSDSAFARSLSEYGIGQAKAFTWSRTAALASEAMSEAVMRLEHCGVQAAVSGWLPKKRLAVLTPLPPCRSGIADYNAKFLPFLARHFDIDLIVDDYEVQDATLTSAFAILKVEQFERVAHLYDAILYEFGNSEFHRYMLPLLSRFPGIVGLHDAFLSGLYGYLDFHLGDSGSYPRTMIANHGPRARRFYAPILRHAEPNGGTMVDLPCTKAVLDVALGIISHSPFNLQVARHSYPEGWQAPYRTIPQMVQLPLPRSAKQISAMRSHLGFNDSAVIVATFGHVAWTKWGDRLLEAFLASPLRDDAQAHLVFVGELAKDSFGQALSASVANAGLGDRIRITGFLDEESYNQYLSIADLAVQLRTKSRGGTPKGVLDCLAYGVPVMVNDDASYRDYPNDVAWKLPADPSTADIAAALTAMGRSSDQRQRFAARGRQYVQDRHDAEKCASLYAATIHECIERARFAAQQAVVDALAPLASRCEDSVQSTNALADFVIDQPQPRFKRQRIFIDVSFIAVHDHESGIQRVVKKIVHHFYTSDLAGFEPVAVQLVAGRLQVASKWLAAKGLLHPHELDSTEPDREVKFNAGDIFFMLDSSWARYREFFPLFSQARGAGARIVTAVYDLLPIQLPSGFIVEGGPAWFRDWLLNGAVNCSDAIVTISNAVAVDLQKFIQCEPGVSRKPYIGYWHLGSDIANRNELSAPDESASRVGSRPYLLMVGTIEPRKMHNLAIDVMERLWDQGEDIGLCIAGKHGWLREDFMQRLRHHKEQGRRFHLFENPADADISQLYASASGLLFLSRGEGFGLPLVEAANYGVPILCSDLAVFREICGSHATYIKGFDVESVALEVSAWWKARKLNNVPSTEGMPRLTWEQSSRALLDVITNEQWIN